MIYLSVCNKYYLSNKIIKTFGMLVLPYTLSFGQSFHDVYKKAYKFSTINQDSALFYSKRLVKIARTNKQKYKAYYMLGNSANYVGLTNLSINSYKAAMKFATGIKIYKCYNSMGIKLNEIGQYKKAILIADSSIRYLKNISTSQSIKSLAYAYDLKANALLGQKNEGSIHFFRKSLRLKNKKEIGFSYYQIAKAFYFFGMIDSAVFYQKKAVETFPIKTSDYQAKMKALLAKYLINKGDIKNALVWLNSANKIPRVSNIIKAELHQIKALYNIGVKNKELKNMNSALQSAIAESKNVVDKKARHNEAIELYNDIITLDQSIEKGHNRDSIITKTSSQNTQPETPIFSWIFGITSLILLVMYALKKPSIFAKTSTAPEIIKKDEQIIVRIEQRTGTIVSDSNKEIVLLLFQGKTFKEVAKELNMKEGTVYKKMERLAKKAGKTDIRSLF